jgi:hypothetical protein
VAPLELTSDGVNTVGHHFVCRAKFVSVGGSAARKRCKEERNASFPFALIGVGDQERKGDR